MISTSTVRPARAADRDPALETLVSAFADDPLAQHLFGDRETLHLHLPVFFGYLLDVSLDGCEVVVTDDLSAASLWTPPGGNRLGVDAVAERWQAALSGLPAGFEERYAQFGALVMPAVPEQPHWHLGVLGVRPDLPAPRPRLRRLRGDAGPGGRRAVPVLLETATPIQPALLPAARIRGAAPHRSAGRAAGLDDVARAGERGMRASALAAVATVAAAVALLLVGVQDAPRATHAPRAVARSHPLRESLRRPVPHP